MFVRDLTLYLTPRGVFRLSVDMYFLDGSIFVLGVDIVGLLPFEVDLIHLKHRDLGLLDAEVIFIAAASLIVQH